MMRQLEAADLLRDGARESTLLVTEQSTFQAAATAVGVSQKSRRDWLDEFISKFGHADHSLVT